MYKYESIAEQIRENIQSKTLLPNQQLPSLREMADAFSTSVGTVKEAYDYLERENFIYSVPKRGFFVLGGKLLPTSSQMLVDFYSGAPDIRYRTRILKNASTRQQICIISGCFRIQIRREYQSSYQPFRGT